jgi:hypothetical protein
MEIGSDRAHCECLRRFASFGTTYVIHCIITNFACLSGNKCSNWCPSSRRVFKSIKVIFHCSWAAVKKKISIFDMYIPCEASSWTLLHQNRKLSSRISLQNQLFCLYRLPAVNRHFGGIAILRKPHVKNHVKILQNTNHAFTIRNMHSLFLYVKCNSRKINRPTKNMTKIVTLLHF